MEVQSPFSWPEDEIVLDYPNKPILITRILKYRRGRREKVRETAMLEKLGPILMTLKMEEGGH